MADESSAQEKTEEATQRRKTQARKKGTVARSADLTNAVVMVVLLAILPAIFASVGSAFLQVMKSSLSTIPMNVEHATLARFAASALTPAAIAIIPLIGAAMVVGLGANFAQVGFVLSTEVLNPNFEKLNPLNGFKRLLSRNSAFDAAKAALKAGLFGYVAWSVVAANMNDVANLSWGSPVGALSKIATLSHTVFLRVAIVWLIIATADVIFQRRRVAMQLRMSKTEVKQEMRELEQSPELKAAIAMRRRRIRRRRLAEAVRNAHVVVTNPTHYAVALVYDKTKMHAPQVVAKGQDLLALKIREIAKQHRVPIVPHPPLARQLYKKCEVGDFVPRELFQAVAEVLAYVYRMINKVRV
jgi:flagellar biosynthetic protein FlhB